MYDDAYGMDPDQQLSSLLEAGKLSEAMTLLEAWHAGEPWNGEILMRMAVVHWLAGEPAHTLRDLDTYLEMDPENAEALSRRAQALYMLGKIEDAEASLARAEALDPTTPGVLLNRALLCEAHGEYARAIISLSAYLEQMPTDHLALARRSHLHRQLGNFTHALLDAQSCVQAHPEDPESHFAEALALVTLERGVEAVQACDRCLQAQGNFLPAQRLKIDLLADTGQLAEAEEQLTSLQVLEPESPHTFLLRARLAMERRRFEEALGWMARYLDDSPDAAHGYYRRGMIYYRMGEYNDALRDFQAFVELAPRAIEGYEQQFLCYLELERLTEAEEIGTQAVQLQPDNYRLQYNLAFAQLLNGKTMQANMGFRVAIQLAPDNEELLLHIYLAYSEQRTPEERLLFLHHTVKQLDSPPILLKGLLAESYLDVGQLEEALFHARGVIAQAPDRPFGYLLSIKALCLLNRHEEALPIADAGLQALPAEGQLHLARALVLRDTGQTDESLRALELAASYLPHEQQEVLRQRALVYGSIGQLDEAIAQLREALSFDPAQVETYFWLAYFLLHTNSPQQALDAADQLLRLAPDSAEGHFLRAAALQALKRRAEAQTALARAQERDGALVERLMHDPVMANLLHVSPQDNIGMRIRQTLTRYWRGRRHTIEHES